MDTYFNTEQNLIEKVCVVHPAVFCFSQHLPRKSCSGALEKPTDKVPVTRSGLWPSHPAWENGNAGAVGCCSLEHMKVQIEIWRGKSWIFLTFLWRPFQSLKLTGSQLACKPGCGCSLGVKWTPVHFLPAMLSVFFKASSSPSRSQLVALCSLHVSHPDARPSGQLPLRDMLCAPSCPKWVQKGGSVILCLDMGLTHPLCWFLWASRFFELFYWFCVVNLSPSCLILSKDLWVRIKLFGGKTCRKGPPTKEISPAVLPFFT